MSLRHHECVELILKDNLNIDPPMPSFKPRRETNYRMSGGPSDVCLRAPGFLQYVLKVFSSCISCFSSVLHCHVVVMLHISLCRMNTYMFYYTKWLSQPHALNFNGDRADATYSLCTITQLCIIYSNTTIIVIYSIMLYVITFTVVYSRFKGTHGVIFEAPSPSSSFRSKRTLGWRTPCIRRQPAAISREST